MEVICRNSSTKDQQGVEKFDLSSVSTCGSWKFVIYSILNNGGPFLK